MRSIRFDSNSAPAKPVRNFLPLSVEREIQKRVVRSFAGSFCIFLMTLFLGHQLVLTAKTFTITSEIAKERVRKEAADRETLLLISEGEKIIADSSINLPQIRTLLESRYASSEKWSFLHEAADALEKISELPLERMSMMWTSPTERSLLLVFRTGNNPLQEHANRLAALLDFFEKNGFVFAFVPSAPGTVTIQASKSRK